MTSDTTRAGVATARMLVVRWLAISQKWSREKAAGKTMVLAWAGGTAELYVLEPILPFAPR